MKFWSLSTYPTTTTPPSLQLYIYQPLLEMKWTDHVVEKRELFGSLMRNTVFQEKINVLCVWERITCNIRTSEGFQLIRSWKSEFLMKPCTKPQKFFKAAKLSDFFWDFQSTPSPEDTSSVQSIYLKCILHLAVKDAPMHHSNGTGQARYDHKKIWLVSLAKLLHRIGSCIPAGDPISSSSVSQEQLPDPSLEKAIRPAILMSCCISSLSSSLLLLLLWPMRHYKIIKSWLSVCICPQLHFTEL